MWSHSKGLLLLLAATGAANPLPTCPARRGGVALASATVFDGPIGNDFGLVPDEAHDGGASEVSTWAVAVAYVAGRKIYAQCVTARPM